MAVKWVFPFEGVRRTIIIVSRILLTTTTTINDHVHAHDCGIKLHSLQGMVQIQLDVTDGFSLVAHYFVQLLEDI